MRFSKVIFSVMLFYPAMLLAQGPDDCAALTGFDLPGFKLEITKAQWYDHRSLPGAFGGPAVELPAHCHVEGALDRRIGVNDVEYAIRFALNLPADWNGRFLFQGGGGLNGTVGEPVGAQAAGGMSALDRGFAVVSNDTGHQARGPFDNSFFDDQEATLNFYYKANPKVTEMAKQLVSSYYRGPIVHSYFVGCSTGGREGMLMTQRYPTYFDGVVSGAPAMRTGMSHCAGGEQTLDSFDMLSAIVDWVENGKAPDRVTATGRSMPGVSRPLCPWPAHPQ